MKIADLHLAEATAPTRSWALIVHAPSWRLAALLAVLAIAVACPPAAAAAVFNFTELNPAYLPPRDDPGKSLVTGDFNHDGQTDIAFDNSSGFTPPQQNCRSEGCVSVLLGHGDATFSGPINYPSDGRPYFGTASLAQGDLNGDGNADLVVANSSGPGSGNCAFSCVAILYGNGDGTFQVPSDLTEGVDNPLAVAVGDFNGDGRFDVAVGNGDDTVSVLLNQGDDAQGHAIFTSAPGSPFSLAGTPSGAINGMTVADLTGNGDVDLVLSGAAASSGSGVCGTSACVQVLTNTNDGSGNFNPAVAYPVDGSGQLAAADLRGGAGSQAAAAAQAATGVQDVVVPGGGGFQVLLNNGDGTLGAASAPFTYPGAALPQGLVVGDLDHDGKLDVAVSDFSSSITALFKGTGNGTFTYDDTVSDPGLLQGTDDALAVADFNGDCKPDLAVGNDDGLIVMRNDTPPAASLCPPPAPPPPSAPTAGSPSTAPTAAPTTTTPTPKTSPGPSPRRRSRLPRVTQRIELAGSALAGCTTSAVRLHITIRLSPRSISRRSANGRDRVSVTTVVRLDGRRIRRSARRKFVLVVPLTRLSFGGHTLTITTTSRGAGVRGTRTIRSWRLTRCSPPPMVTG